MHRILTYCSASVRKSLQRLDYISPEGSSGQESLVKRSRESKATCQTVERSDLGDCRNKVQNKSNSPDQKSNSYHSIHHIATGNKDGTKGISNKCWICKSLTHCTYECQKFLVLDRARKSCLLQLPKESWKKPQVIYLQ